MRVFALNTIVTCTFRQRNLRFTLSLDRFVCCFDSIDHFILAHLWHLTLDHDNAVHASGNHHVHVCTFQFCAVRIDDKCAINSSHSNFWNRTIERNIANCQASRGCQSRQTIRQHFRVGRHQLNHHLGAGMIIRRKRWTQSAINQTHNEYLSIGGTRFALEKATWESSCRGILFAVIDRKRQKIHVISHVVRWNCCRQQHCIAASYDNGTVRLLRKLAGF